MSCDFFEPIDNDCGFVEDLRYLRDEDNKNLRQLQSDWFLEQIDQYGMKVEYQQSNYSTENHNSIYGEHTTKRYSDPVELISYVIMNQDSIILNQFGIESDADITFFIHIDRFFEIFGEGSEPLAGDLVRLTELGGTDRPNGRGPATFEVTRRDDEDLQLINPLLGHYVWLIRAKRHDFSFDNNVEPEKRMNQVDDDSPYIGNDIPSLELVENIFKTYNQDADTLGKEIFDYDDYEKSNDSVYGDY